MKDPETLSDEVYDVPPPFEGEQTLVFNDYDVKEKPTGFWVLLRFSGENGEQASWSGNFHKAPDTPGRKQNHAISWRGLREFFKAIGYSDGDIPACGARTISAALNKVVSVDGNGARVKALIGQEDKGDGRSYTTASRFKAA